MGKHDTEHSFLARKRSVKIIFVVFFLSVLSIVIGYNLAYVSTGTVVNSYRHMPLSLSISILELILGAILLVLLCVLRRKGNERIKNHIGANGLDPKQTFGVLSRHMKHWVEDRRVIMNKSMLIGLLLGAVWFQVQFLNDHRVDVHSKEGIDVFDSDTKLDAFTSFWIASDVLLAALFLAHKPLHIFCAYPDDEPGRRALVPFVNSAAAVCLLLIGLELFNTAYVVFFFNHVLSTKDTATNLLYTFMAEFHIHLALCLTDVFETLEHEPIHDVDAMIADVETDGGYWWQRGRSDIERNSIRRETVPMESMVAVPPAPSSQKLNRPQGDVTPLYRDEVSSPFSNYAQPNGDISPTRNPLYNGQSSLQDQPHRSDFHPPSRSHRKDRGTSFFRAPAAVGKGMGKELLDSGMVLPILILASGILLTAAFVFTKRTRATFPWFTMPFHIVNSVACIYLFIHHRHSRKGKTTSDPGTSTGIILRDFAKVEMIILTICFVGTQLKMFGNGFVNMYIDEVSQGVNQVCAMVNSATQFALLLRLRDSKVFRETIHMPAKTELWKRVKKQPFFFFVVVLVVFINAYLWAMDVYSNSCHMAYTVENRQQEPIDSIHCNTNGRYNGDEHDPVFKTLWGVVLSIVDPLAEEFRFLSAAFMYQFAFVSLFNHRIEERRSVARY